MDEVLVRRRPGILGLICESFRTESRQNGAIDFLPRLVRCEAVRAMRASCAWNMENGFCVKVLLDVKPNREGFQKISALLRGHSVSR